MTALFGYYALIGILIIPVRLACTKRPQTPSVVGDANGQTSMVSSLVANQDLHMTNTREMHMASREMDFQFSVGPLGIIFDQHGPEGRIAITALVPGGQAEALGVPLGAVPVSTNGTILKADMSHAALATELLAMPRPLTLTLQVKVAASTV